MSTTIEQAAPCVLCGKPVRGCNTKRHMARWHPEPGMVQCADPACKRWITTLGYCCREHEERHARRRAQKVEQQRWRRANVPGYRERENEANLLRYWTDPTMRERRRKWDARRYAEGRMGAKQKVESLDAPVFSTGACLLDLTPAPAPALDDVLMARRLREIVGDIDERDVDLMGDLALAELRARLLAEGFGPGVVAA